MDARVSLLASRDPVSGQQDVLPRYRRYDDNQLPATYDDQAHSRQDGAGTIDAGARRAAPTEPSELVAAFLAAAADALANAAAPYTLRSASNRGEVAHFGASDSTGGTWRWSRHGLDIGYRSPSGIQVDLSFIGGEGWSVFDAGTIASFATFNGYVWGRHSRDGVIEVCEQLVADGRLRQLDGSAERRYYAIPTP